MTLGCPATHPARQPASAPPNNQVPSIQVPSIQVHGNLVHGNQVPTDRAYRRASPGRPTVLFRRLVMAEYPVRRVPSLGAASSNSQCGKRRSGSRGRNYRDRLEPAEGEKPRNRRRTQLPFRTRDPARGASTFDVRRLEPAGAIRAIRARRGGRRWSQSTRFTALESDTPTVRRRRRPASAGPP